MSVAQLIGHSVRASDRYSSIWLNTLTHQQMQQALMQLELGLKPDEATPTSTLTPTLTQASSSPSAALALPTHPPPPLDDCDTSLDAGSTVHELTSPREDETTECSSESAEEDDRELETELWESQVSEVLDWFEHAMEKRNIAHIVRFRTTALRKIAELRAAHPDDERFKVLQRRCPSMSATRGDRLTHAPMHTASRQTSQEDRQDVRARVW